MQRLSKTLAASIFFTASSIYAQQFSTTAPNPVKPQTAEIIDSKHNAIRVVSIPEKSLLEEHGFSWAAFLLSLLSLCWSGAIANKARKQSVSDEFWIRQVCYPAIIVPTLQLADWLEKQIGEPATQETLKESRKKILEHRRAIQVLPNLLGNTKDAQASHHKLTTFLQTVEDAVSIFLAKSLYAKASDAEETTARRSIQALVTETINIIRLHQQKV